MHIYDTRETQNHVYSKWQSATHDQHFPLLFLMSALKYK